MNLVDICLKSNGHVWLVATLPHSSALQALSLFSPKPEEPEGVTYAQLNTTALSRAASAPAEETPSSCDYTTVKV